MSTSTTMKISLPKKMRDDIKSLVKSGHYSTTSGFIQQIIDKELRIAKETKVLNKFINNGIASGVSKRNANEFFNTLLK